MSWLVSTWYGILTIFLLSLLLIFLLSLIPVLYRKFFKRFYDILLSLLGIIISSPILIIIAITIKVSSKGPIIFKQNRLGKNGRVFSIYKFRTMVLNAENIGDGLKISTESDPRITKVGKFLRSTSLDELPQLFNVFLGSMSLVGPRPPVTYQPYNGYNN